MPMALLLRPNSLAMQIAVRANHTIVDKSMPLRHLWASVWSTNWQCCGVDARVWRCYCRPSCLAMKIHCALPTRVLPKRISDENAVLRPLLGIIFACTDGTQNDVAWVTPAPSSVQLQGLQRALAHRKFPPTQAARCQEFCERTAWMMWQLEG